VVSNLIVVILVVAHTGWHLDFINLYMLHDISSPLHQGSQLTDIRNHTLKQFKLWDLLVGTYAVVDDGIFVVMEFLKCLDHMIKGIHSKYRSLHEVTEIEECTDGSKEPLRDTTSYNANDIVLYSAVISSSNLLQLGYTFIKCPESHRVWIMEKWKSNSVALSARMHHLMSWSQANG